MEPVLSEDTGSESDDDMELFTQKFMSQVKNTRTLNAESDEGCDSDDDDSCTSDSDDSVEISQPNEIQHGHLTNKKDKTNKNHKSRTKALGLDNSKDDVNEDDTSDDSSEDGDISGSVDDLARTGHGESDGKKSVEDSEASSDEDNDSGSSDSDQSDSSNQSGDEAKQFDPQSGDEAKQFDPLSGDEAKHSEDQTEADKQKTIEDGFAQLRKELADLPFNELQKLKEQIGVKAYNEAMFGSHSGRNNSQRKIFKRDNKNRPKEMSSKRTVQRFREVVQIKKKTHRDPRFDDLSGKYDEKLFKQAYSFIDDVKQREKQKLIRRYEKEKDVEKKRQIEQLIKRMNQEERSEREKVMRQRREAERKKKEKELVKQGKKPYFLKKVDERKLELAEKFKDLKKSGKVENYLAKKRRKTAAKDRRHLPNKHFVFTGL